MYNNKVKIINMRYGKVVYSKVRLVESSLAKREEKKKKS